MLLRRIIRRVVLSAKTFSACFVGAFFLYGMYSFNHMMTRVPEVHAAILPYHAINKVKRKKAPRTPIEIAAMCLATNVYFEARGEPTKGQIAVAQVTYNTRAAKDRDRICRVVMANRQFSWANGSPRKKGNKMIMIAFESPKDRRAWKGAMIVAHKVLANKTPDLIKGATHFHAVKYRGKKLMPKWAKAPCMQRIGRIGNHIFYKCTHNKYPK